MAAQLRTHPSPLAPNSANGVTADRTAALLPSPSLPPFSVPLPVLLEI
jgi:hypothetical protein